MSDLHIGNAPNAGVERVIEVPLDGAVERRDAMSEFVTPITPGPTTYGASSKCR